MDAPLEISKLVDRWCERRALRPLRMVLPSWPPPNGFSDEWRAVWAAMRHVRSMCREELAQHGESEAVNAIVADLSQRLFPQESPRHIEQIAEQLTAAIFGDQRS
jgi:hypothetical protein